MFEIHDALSELRQGIGSARIPCYSHFYVLSLTVLSLYYKTYVLNVKKNYDACNNLFESHDALSELRQDIGSALIPWYLAFRTDYAETNFISLLFVYEGG